MSDRVIIRKQDRIDYILGGICNYYGLTMIDFKKYMRIPDTFNKKRIAMLILYDIADCSLKDIHYAMGYENKTSLPNIHRHISNLREDISDDTVGNKALKKEYKDILKQLGL